MTESPKVGLSQADIVMAFKTVSQVTVRVVTVPARRPLGAAIYRFNLIKCRAAEWPRARAAFKSTLEARKLQLSGLKPA